MTSTFLGNLSQDLIKLFENNDEYNVIIEVGEGSIKQSYRAHTTILCYRCPYLYNELKNISYNDGNIKVIKKPKVLVKVFDIIIRYIYGGVVNLETIPASLIFDLLISASKFGLKELSKYVESYLIEHQTSWLRLNFSRVYQISCNNNEFTKLREFYNDIITKHPGIILDSEDFYKINEEALISIIKRDDLQLEETKIWDLVIKWGIAQNSTLPSTIEQWKDTDFLVLKKTLQNCLPYVRFFCISGEDVVLKIRPYYQILETQLWMDIISKTMAPNVPISSTITPARKLSSIQLPTRNVAPLQQVKISSKIITTEQAEKIISWINEKKSYGASEFYYEFELILVNKNGTTGFFKSFLNSCINKEDLILVLKASTGEILGGYIPVCLNGKLKTNQSFIFSLEMESTKKSIISRVITEDEAINIGIDFPSFISFGSTDFKIYRILFETKVNFYCKKADYEFNIRKDGAVSIADRIEVFRIVKKKL